MPSADSDSLVFQLIRAARERPWSAGAVVLASATLACANAAFAATAGAVVGGLAGGRIEPVAGSADSIRSLTHLGLGVAVVKTAAGAALAWSQRGLAASTANRIRLGFAARLLGRGSQVPVARLAALLTVRLREVEAAVDGGALTALRAGLQLVALFVALVVISPALSAVALLGMVPFAGLLGALRRRTRIAHERAQALAESLEMGVGELLQGTDLFRAYGAGGRSIEAITRADAARSTAAARAEAVQAAVSGANEIIAAIAIVGVVALAERGSLTATTGSLAPFTAVFFMAYRPVRDLADARGWLERGGRALAAIREATREGVPESAAPPVPGPPGPVRPASAPPPLRLVAFGARDRGPATTASIRPGEIVLVAGPTGAGKTTLFRTLLGLEPARGALLVDGVDTSAAPPGPRSRPFAWVPQEAPLLTATIAENVTLLAGSRDDACAALALIGAEGLVRAADDRVGPGARPLSGGERRQVALARALVTGLPVLLLDEPTEGLDVESARVVEAAIVRLRGKKTVLVASHRPDLARVADRVLPLGAAETDRPLAAE